MTTINRLTRTDTVSAGDVVPVYVQNQGDARGASLSLIAQFVLSTIQLTGTDFVTQYATPVATGFSVQISNTSANTHLILAPTGSFATGTLVLPVLANVIEGQQIMVTTLQPVAALTISPNGAVAIGAPTALVAFQTFTLKFDSSSFTWYMITNSVQQPMALGGPLGTPSSGNLANCTGLPILTGVSGLGASVAAFLAAPSSANLRTALTDETGAGAAVFADSPALTSIPTAPTPAVGTNTAQLATAAMLQAEFANKRAWTSYTPVVAATTGTYTAASATGIYLVMFGVCYIDITITVTTKGTGVNPIFTLPFAAKAGNDFFPMLAVETVLNGKSGVAQVLAGLTTAGCKDYNNADLVTANGSVVKVRGYYTIA